MKMNVAIFVVMLFAVVSATHSKCNTHRYECIEGPSATCPKRCESRAGENYKAVMKKASQGKKDPSEKGLETTIMACDECHDTAIALGATSADIDLGEGAAKVHSARREMFDTAVLCREKATAIRLPLLSSLLKTCESKEKDCIYAARISRDIFAFIGNVSDAGKFMMDIGKKANDLCSSSEKSKKVAEQCEEWA